MTHDQQRGFSSHVSGSLYAQSTRPPAKLRRGNRNIRATGLLILGLSFVIGVIGYFNTHSHFAFKHFLMDFYANLSVELGSIAITVLIIDNLNDRRATAFEKERLILQLGSPHNTIAIEALRQLWLHRWGFGDDTSLQGIFLERADLRNAPLSLINLRQAFLNDAKFTGASLVAANLQGASLYDADLSGRNTNMTGVYLQGARLSRANLSEAKMQYAQLVDVMFENTNLCGTDLTGSDLTDANFYQANLEGAIVTEEQLSQAGILLGATMPDGTRYDGRFHLVGDIASAREDGIDVNDYKAIAEWYSMDRWTIDVEILSVPRLEAEYLRRRETNEWLHPKQPGNWLSRKELEQLRDRLQKILVQR